MKKGYQQMLDIVIGKDQQILDIYLFIIYICLKQNYIKQYKSLRTNALSSGYRIL